MDRKASDNRRRDRQREGLWSLLHSLPPPWGAAAPSTYTDLHSWCTQQGLAVQWDTMPATVGASQQHSKQKHKHIAIELQALQNPPLHRHLSHSVSLAHCSATRQIEVKSMARQCCSS